MTMSDFVSLPSGRAVDNDDIVVDGTVGGIVLLSLNKNRKSALILNVGSEDMRITTDGSSPTSTHGKLVPSGGALVLSSPFCPKDAVKAIRQGSVNTTANASEIVE